MKLIKTSLFSAVITFIRIGSGFVAGKAVAMFAGPSGVALIGAFSNFISIVLTFANGGINTGVVKYTAEYDGDEKKLKILFSVSFKISLYCSLVIGVLLVFLAPYFAKIILTDSLYSNPIRVLGFTIILYSLNSLLISILNGKKQIKTYTLVNTLGSIIGLIFTVLLVYYFKVAGALYALVLAQSIVFFVTLALIVKSPWFSRTYFHQSFDKGMFKKLGAYSLMSIISILSVPVSQLILRNIIVHEIGIDSAGYWQGMMRISDGYLMIITTSLATYYLPKLSSLKTDKELRFEILKGYKIILPAVFIGCVMIYFLRLFIIKVLYTESFLEMESLFFWQLIGDFFKVAAWILGNLILAKAMVKMYIIIEIVFTLSYLILSTVFIHVIGLEGVVLAFALNYLFSAICMVYIFRNMLFSKKLS